MTAAVTGLVPFVHVADVERSAAFYELLGLEVNARFEPHGRLAWVWMEHDGARVMLTLAGEPVVPEQQAVLFYLYSHDLAGLREHLLASGVDAGEIVDGTPGPREEMRVVDPDGYVLMIAQISEDTG
jgi:catechol 2,3-dioxygenase-like lactoylglutathione lyase family enzyme